MRPLLFALLIVNLAFFAWARWIDVPAPAVSAASESIPALELAGRPASTPPVSNAPPAPAASASAPVPAPPAVTAPVTATPAPAEASPATASAVAPVTPAPASVAPASAGTARCRSVGPFEDANAANVIADRLRSRGFTPRERSAMSSNPNVYWVYIGELTSDAQKQAIKTLNTAGIHDAVSMTQPEQSDRVSVGVFADQAHAVRRAEQVRALGFKPTLGMRQRSLPLHWVDFDVGAAVPEPSASQLVGVAPRPAPGIGPAKVVDCPSSEGG